MIPAELNCRSSGYADIETRGITGARVVLVVNNQINQRQQEKTMNSMSHRRLEISVSKFELVAWVALVAAAVYCLMQAGLNVVA